MALESRLAWLFHCDLHCALWHGGGLEPAFRAELIARWFPLRSLSTWGRGEAPGGCAPGLRPVASLASCFASCMGLPRSLCRPHPHMRCLPRGPPSPPGTWLQVGRVAGCLHPPALLPVLRAPASSAAESPAPPHRHAQQREPQAPRTWATVSKVVGWAPHGLVLPWGPGTSCPTWRWGQSFPDGPLHGPSGVRVGSGCTSEGRVPLGGGAWDLLRLVSLLGAHPPDARPSPWAVLGHPL